MWTDSPLGIQAMSWKATRVFNSKSPGEIKQPRFANKFFLFCSIQAEKCCLKPALKCRRFLEVTSKVSL